jgi:uncharacterized protein YktA (UPF0223 family)
MMINEIEKKYDDSNKRGSDFRTGKRAFDEVVNEKFTERKLNLIPSC